MQSLLFMRKIKILKSYCILVWMILFVQIQSLGQEVIAILKNQPYPPNQYELTNYNVTPAVSSELEKEGASAEITLIISSSNATNLSFYSKNEANSVYRPVLTVKTAQGLHKLSPTDDAYVDEAYPNSNFGSDFRIMAKQVTTGGNRESFIRFDLSSITDPIDNASLQLAAYRSVTVPNCINISYISSLEWNESTINWNNRIPPVETDSDPLVYFETNGRLAYTRYANKGESNLVNTMIDFSKSGYMGGGVKIPVVPVVKTLSPVEGDNLAQIQAAIDEVSSYPLDENGFRGAILLKAGLYEISDKVNINFGGIVLRGEGQNKAENGGTELVYTKKSQGTFFYFKGKVQGSVDNPVRIATDYVGSGADHFELEDASGFSVGDSIIVRRTPNQKWVETIGMLFEGNANDGDDKPWTPEDYKIDNLRVITNIDGNTIYIDMPVCDAMQKQYGGGEIAKHHYSGWIEKCGIENMWLTSVYESNTDEDHGWIAIQMRDVRNAWAKGVTSQYFGYSCASIGNSSQFVTIEDCAQIDPKSLTQGGRKYSFNTGGAAGNLIQRVYAFKGRHDFNAGAKDVGPNVFLDCVSENPLSESGPHQRWATGILYDNIYGGALRVRNRGSYGSGHGWAGAQIVWYNCTSFKNDNDGTAAFVVQSPPGAQNFGIGAVSSTSYSGNGYWESKKKHIEPRSLYVQQLIDRVGLEDASKTICDEQLNGTIKNKIRNWKGIGTLIADKDNPIALAKDTVIHLNEFGHASLTASEIDAGSYDYSKIISVEISQTEFDCQHIGKNVITLIVTDAFNNVGTCQATITVEKDLPKIDSLYVPSLVNIADTVRAEARFTNNKIESALWDWGNGIVTEGLIDGNNIQGEYIYPEPGLYNVTLIITDICGNTDRETSEYLVIYDPCNGHVTGGGVITSAAGDLLSNIKLKSDANFGFEVKYDGAFVDSTSQLTFHIKEAKITLKSSKMDWLMIHNAQAVFSGKGTINGAGQYTFILSIIDGDVLGKNSPDYLCIIIKDEKGATFYDNQSPEPYASPASEQIKNGSIKIHKGCNQEKSASLTSDSFDVTLYPNPVFDRIVLETSKIKGVIAVEVYDMNGRMFLKNSKVSVLGGHAFIDVSNIQMKAGSYLMRVTDNELSQSVSILFTKK